jgi:RNA polymerase sigma-70 factor (ECF subfamily)
MDHSSQWHQIRRFFAQEREKLVVFVRGLIDDAAERDAEDIVQDVAFHLFEKGDVMEQIEHIGSYIYHALRNRVVDSYRRRRKHQSLDQPVGDGDECCLADIIEARADDLGSGLERDDLCRQALAMVRELPERERALIVLTEMEGYSFAELAEQWSVPVGTLLSRKSRQLRKIRDAMRSRVA